MTSPSSQPTAIKAPGLVSGLFGLILSIALFVISLVLSFFALSREAYVLFAVGAPLVGGAIYLSRRFGVHDWRGYLAYRGWRSMASGTALMLAIGCVYWVFDSSSTAVASRSPQLKGADLILGRDAHSDVNDFGKIVEVKFTVAENFSSVQQFSMHQDVIKLVPALLAKYPAATTVEVIGRANLTDKRGNTSLDPVMRVTYTRANSEKTNWAKILPNDIPAVADYYWVHPVMTR